MSKARRASGCRRGVRLGKALVVSGVEHTGERDADGDAQLHGRAETAFGELSYADDIAPCRAVHGRAVHVGRYDKLQLEEYESSGASRIDEQFYGDALRDMRERVVKKAGGGAI